MRYRLGDLIGIVWIFVSGVWWDSPPRNSDALPLIFYPLTNFNSSVWVRRFSLSMPTQLLVKLQVDRGAESWSLPFIFHPVAFVSHAHPVNETSEANSWRLSVSLVTGESLNELFGGNGLTWSKFHPLKLIYPRNTSSEKAEAVNLG